MKKYTIEDLKSSPDTLKKFFLLQGKADLSMFNDAYEFYLKMSTSKWKKKSKKKFTKYFLESMNFYNSILK